MRRLLGPRQAFLIGSRRPSGDEHVCAASYVSTLGDEPPALAVALKPEWISSSNIRREMELTVNLMSTDFLDAILIAGSKGSGVTLEQDVNKFRACGLTVE